MQAITLSIEEMLLLDGKVNPEAQQIIDSAKEANALQNTSGISESEAKMAMKIITSARKELRLSFYYTNITDCPCCGRKDGYWPVRRTTKYKQKGKPDYDNPKLIRAYSINPGFVSVKHYISLGFCESCKDKILSPVLEALKNEEIEIDPILSGVPARFKRHRDRKCKKCGWEGHDGEMTWAQTLMGDGKFPAYCPQCNAGGIFNRDVELLDGFSIVPVSK